VRLIRKQKNRRLYDTVDRRNVTLRELAAIIGTGDTIRVEDGASGENITHSVLLQIVTEREGPGGALLSQSFLEGLIRLYSNPASLLASTWFDASMAAFERQQAELMRRFGAGPQTGAAASAMAGIAQEGLRSWMTLQRSLFEIWAGRGPDDAGRSDDKE
jgi:polyhydroxyalkanoate synthesis repressor PhaR